jgi:hypothetical protein
VRAVPGEDLEDSASERTAIDKPPELRRREVYRRDVEGNGKPSAVLRTIEEMRMGMTVMPCSRCGRLSTAMVCDRCAHQRTQEGGSIDTLRCTLPVVSIPGFWFVAGAVRGSRSN